MPQFERTGSDPTSESRGASRTTGDAPPYPDDVSWFVYVDGTWTTPLSTAARRRFDDYDDRHPTDRIDLERTLRVTLPPWAEIEGRGRLASLSFEAGAPIPAWLVSESSWHADHRNVVALTDTGERLVTGACDSSAVDRTVAVAESILRAHVYDDSTIDDESAVEDSLDG